MMTKKHVSEKIVTAVMGMFMVWGAMIYWKNYRQKMNREIDEFDRIMRALKMDTVLQRHASDMEKKHVKERK